ncbi:MAG TPA: PD-(D/E)XK nuclease family protein [Lacipirellulaceae bacterium]|nr:PD-(D/E)XK nuclease family protein [Lacipirellulaceae bacterium]
MSPQVTVYLGPARSGKSSELLRQYADILRSDTLPQGRALWLAPTGRSVAQLRSQLVRLDIDACLSPGVMTFGGLCRRILNSSQSRLRPIATVAEREIVRRCVHAVAKAGELEFFAEAATRDSFVDLVSDHIRELRRRGIDASLYARVGRKREYATQHQELAQLYERYEPLLTGHGLVDAEGLVWAACDIIQHEANVLPQQLELIVADGFSDFTAGQHELLRVLAQRSSQLLISLPADASNGPIRTGRFSDQSNPPSAPRDDLFAKPAATLAALRRNFPKLSEGHFTAQPTSWPALDHIRQQLFRPPRSVPPTPTDVANSLNRLEFVEAASAQDEIVRIAQRIKRLLTTPLPFREGQGEGSTKSAAAANRERESSPRPGDILVVFRSLVEAAPRVREVFQEFGIPYFLEADQPLSSTPTYKTLSALVRLQEQDWPFRRTVAVITNNALSAIDGESRRAADWLVRDLQIAEGRAALLDRARQLAAVDASPDELSEHARRRIGEARAALPALEELRKALDELPAEATASEWAAALAHLGAQLGLSPFNCSGGESQSAKLRTGRLSDQSIDENAERNDFFHIDQLAWQLIVDGLASLERLDGWLGMPARKFGRRELLIALSDLAQHASLPQMHDDVGRVLILSAASARTIRARHVFLAGMSEQAFPSWERPGRLATEAEYRGLARAANPRSGPRPAHRAPTAVEPTRSQEEMLLFYEVLSSAEESLTISYPALDERAQTLPPSPYVAEIRRTFDEPTRKKLVVARPELSPVRRTGAPMSRSDWRVQAVTKALEKDTKLLAGLFADDPTRSLGAAVEAGLRIIHARARRESFGPAEGILESASAAARFAERFGPQHLWSPSQWETYAACPYKFFMQNVLGLEPLGDLVLETDFARRGSRLHQVLAGFHRGWRDVCDERSWTADEEAAQFLDHLQRLIDAQITGAPSGTIDAALLELDRRQIRKWAGAHFEHHVKYHGDCSKLGGEMTPAHFEFRFGSRRPGDAESDPGSVQDAFILDIDGEKIRITGQIDRIDVGTVGGRKVFNVIDYKTGKRIPLRQEHIESGERLQLPIYVEAAQSLIFSGEATPLFAGYWSMASGFDAKSPLVVKHEAESRQRWAEIKATVRHLVQQFVSNIRSGKFPVASRDEQCTSRCEFNTICRITQIRSLGKPWPPEQKP